MIAGGLQVVGLLALLAGACELVLRWIRNRRASQQRAWVRRRLLENDIGAPEGGVPFGALHPNQPGAPCPWPTLEPEVERLRQRGAL